MVLIRLWSCPWHTSAVWFLLLDVGYVPTFWQKPSQPPPCLPKVKIILIILWSCPWHQCAVRCCLLMLGLFQLSDKSPPNLQRVCPKRKWSLSFYDLVLDTSVLYDAVYWRWVCSNFLKKAFTTSTVSAQDVNGHHHFMILPLTHQCCMMLLTDVGFVPTFSKKPSQPPPCLPKM